MMNTYEVTISDAAGLDVNHIYNYYSQQDNEACAIEVYNRLVKFIFNLDWSPERMPVFDDDKSIRKGICGNYLVIYEVNIEAREVVILRVFSSAMDLTDLSF